MNSLAHSSSPYLRQHAHNPVDWHPWSEEAIAKAKAEDKPILLSIGYSTCYWCHVMEREVFENPAIAELMNRTFINIKIDREEHPQLDDIYMTVRQLMTHEGGWPNNVFLTPDLKPFHAGGTYGAEDKYGKPSFARLIEWLHDGWINKRDEILKMADEATEVTRGFLTTQPAETSPELISGAISAAREALAKHHDPQAGGFFQAPKFPQEPYLQFLLTYHELTGDKDALDMAAYSLGKMAAGGIYDHAGGGFHRYAVDKDWMVPHFEKMLYNQAQLARCYTQAANITGNAYFADIAKNICDFIAGPFTDGSGAFYAAIDAETDAVEGAYYVWKREEVESLLTTDEMAFFIQYYGVAEVPKIPGHKHPEGDVIVAHTPIFEAAIRQNTDYETIAKQSKNIMRKLHEKRKLRTSPGRDEKIIVSWNGLMIDALAYAGKSFGNTDYIERAHKAAQYILQYAIDNEGRLTRCVTAGRAQHRATAEDYAYLIKGLLSLYTASKDKTMLAAAVQLTEDAEELFGDSEQPGFFYTQHDEPLLVRIKSGGDSTLPNPNAVMAQNYITLCDLKKEGDYQRKAKAIIETFIAGEKAHWLEYTSMLSAAQKLGIYTFTDNAPHTDSAPKYVTIHTAFVPGPIAPGKEGELHISFTIADGYSITSPHDKESGNIPLQISLQGDSLQLLSIHYPDVLPYQGEVTVIAQIRHLSTPKSPRAWLQIRYQPCSDDACFAVEDQAVELLK